MRISDWSSDVCSSDLMLDHEALVVVAGDDEHMLQYDLAAGVLDHAHDLVAAQLFGFEHCVGRIPARRFLHVEADAVIDRKEHTSELQSLMRISYAVFCLKKKKKQQKQY